MILVLGRRLVRIGIHLESLSSSRISPLGASYGRSFSRHERQVHSYSRPSESGAHGGSLPFQPRYYPRGDGTTYEGIHVDILGAHRANRVLEALS